MIDLKKRNKLSDLFRVYGDASPFIRLHPDDVARLNSAGNSIRNPSATEDEIDRGIADLGLFLSKYRVKYVGSRVVSVTKIKGKTTPRPTR